MPDKVNNQTDSEDDRASESRIAARLQEQQAPVDDAEASEAQQSAQATAESPHRSQSANQKGCSDMQKVSGASQRRTGYANVDGHYHKPNKLTYKNVSFRADDREAADFSSARSLSTLATITGVFSVFFGGVVLSVIGLIAGIFAWRKMTAISKNHPEDPRVYKALKHAGIAPLVVCVVALALNALMLALVFPLYQNLFDSGQISNVLQMPNSGFNPGGNPYDFGAGSGGTNSTWG